MARAHRASVLRSADMTTREMSAPSASERIDVAGFTCAEVLFAIHDRYVLRAIEARERRATWLMGLRMDSESEILQAKNFRAHRHLCSVACVEGRLCCESSPFDSQHADRSARVVRDRFAMKKWMRRWLRGGEARRRRAQSQSPSLLFRRSLTACGFALPPDDFITWPTNHPSA
jgi:hypothetical protein